MVALKDKGNFQSTPRDAIIEAAARALKDASNDVIVWQDYRNSAAAVLAAVTPLIEANALERMRAALEEIDNLIGMIECTDKHNLALLPLFLEQQKRADAALTRMEQP